ncbi:hypothetical protein EI94DRAFT_1797105 [Lactarius quietus]|nr:hypothetical protein EI94DRAFT_1797105 [Lactarius quietus]
MSWFNNRKQRNEIPPVDGGSNSTSTGSSRSAVPGAPSTDAVRDRYGRNSNVDIYSRGQGNLDADRGELFAGFNPEKVSTNRFAHDGPTLREPPPGEENEEDVEAIKQQTRFIKQDSVNSTRNALRMAREAEETARGTITRLGSQSEKLANTERHLDVSKGHSQRAEDKTDELKKLNRSIFRPAITFNKDAKRAAQEAKLLQRYEEEREEHEKAMLDIRDTQNRLGKASAYDSREEDIGTGRPSRTAAQQALQKEQRKRYQFEATASDDELEDELDGNLDEISDMTKRLKALGSAMGQELDNQNNRIERIEEKTVNLDKKSSGTRREYVSICTDTRSNTHYVPAA